MKFPRPSAIVLDVGGTLATKKFMAYSKESKQFVKENIKGYLIDNYPKKKELRLDLNFMRLQESQDRAMAKTGAPKLGDGRDKKSTARSIVRWVNYKLDKDPDCPAMALFQFHMTEWGYNRGLLLTELYPEVNRCLKKWFQDRIPLYITLGSDSFANLVMSKTTAGNLIPLLAGHINLMEFVGDHGDLRKNFANLGEILDLPATKILFVTRIATDAKRADREKINVALVLRSDFDPDYQEKLKAAQRQKEGKSAVGSLYGKTLSGKTSSKTSIKGVASKGSNTSAGFSTLSTGSGGEIQEYTSIGAEYNTLTVRAKKDPITITNEVNGEPEPAEMTGKSYTNQMKDLSSVENMHRIESRTDSKILIEDIMAYKVITNLAEIEF